MAMKSLILRIFLAAVFVFSFLLLIPSQSSAQIDCKAGNLTPQEALQCGASGAAGQDVTGQKVSDISAESAGKLSSTIKKILNVLSAVVGIIAIIMIIIGGFRYVASAGKQENITAAKNTILYAIIGLIVVALAQAIVHFVLREATEVTQSSSTPTCVNGRLDSGPDQGKPC
ncbi:hypothetical protein A3J32_02495 [Candidatus Saccharibacteria bacterium RIFCSPLOWO2_02_FULL_46_7]|nr:MAG: hypothetical protein A3J32_02495 [Candidatus Saccharibacteria bacterium RIFCSPLOWO2_02_FULL_46_7]